MPYRRAVTPGLLSIDSALPSAVLRAPAKPGLAIDSADSALPSAVLRAPAKLGLAIAVAMVLAASTTGCRRAEPVPDGDVAASLTLPSLGEHTFDPATLKGKPCLVLFVSPTCSHCLATIPRAMAAAKAADANLVAVFVAGGKQNAEGVVSHTNFTGTALVDDGTLRKKYNIKGVPHILVLGPDGHARQAFHGERGAEDESLFKDALADAK